MLEKMFAQLLIISMGLSVALGTDVDNCVESEAPQPIHVDIQGCDKQPCSLTRGQSVTMIMNFTAPVPIETLRAKVLAQPEGTQGTVPFPLPEPDACNELTNTHCPLEINEPAVYRLEMPVRRIYPKINLRLEFSVLYNGEIDVLTCFSLNCRVV